MVEIARELGVETKVAGADQPTTAQILARTAPERLIIVPTGRDAEALSPLPLEVASDSHLAISYLRKLGVGTLGALREFSPVALGRRIGPEGDRLVRIARAEPMPAPERHAPPELPVISVDLEPPIPSGEPVLFVVKRLLDELEAHISGQGLAIVALRLTLTFEGGSTRAEEILLPRAIRALRPLVAILGDRVLNTDKGSAPGDGRACFAEGHEPRIVTVEVRALGVTPAHSTQSAFFDQKETSTEGLPSLVVRLAGTLGREGIYQAVLVPTWRPEASWQPAALDATTDLQTVSAAQRKKPMKAEIPSDPAAALELRPLPSQRPVFLLPEPLAVSGQLEPGCTLEWRGDRGVVRRAWGPERLRSEWWSAPFERDYYVVDLEDGERLWMYRDGIDGTLHLHGIFD
jgi:protein ImuB